MPSTRKLAAVMFTDIAGYTALMQQDETRGLEMRARHREIFNTTTSTFKGQILQYYGDGTLSIFDSVINAVKCATEMQRQFQEKPVVPVRIGLHMGDIVVAKEEVIGDAVNVASRIESMALVGSVLVSERVQMDIENHEEIKTQSLGHYHLKNVEKSVEVFALVNEGLVIPGTDQMLNKGRVEKNVPNNLSNPATRFFGREKELAKIKELLSGNRLVTLQGSGGCGKTRLSIEIARQSMNLFPSGVWFIPLAPVTNAQLVAGIIAETLQVVPEKDTSIEDTIAKMITEKKLLVVLDNCEHLIEECARILNLLVRNTREPHFLTTSREALNISGETTYRTPPLSVPTTPSELGEILGFDSVQLFRDRVLMNKPDFEVNENNSHAVSSICRKLDGIPLAIEMAASRIKVMDPETVLERLSDQFRLLSRGLRDAPPHQQTLRATIDWSYDLLAEDERVLFQRLSVFTGDFDLEDAEKICGYDPLPEFEVLDLLTRLVDKSLVITVQKEKSVRYTLLELMKQYGSEIVAKNNDLDQLQERFSNYYLDKTILAHNERYARSLVWSSWFILELSNLLGALTIFLKEPAKRLKLASLLSEFFFDHANLSVGRQVLKSALDDWPERNSDRARALCGLGFLEILINPDLGYEKIKEGIEIAQDSSDEQLRVDVLWVFASYKSLFQEWEEAKEILQEGLQIARDKGDPWMELKYRNQRTWLTITHDKPEKAEAEVKTNLEEAKSLGNDYFITDTLHMFADIAFLKQDYKVAEQRYIDATKSAQPSGSGLAVGVMVQGIAMSVAGQGRHEKGLKLYGATLAKLDELEAVIPSLESVTSRFDHTIGKSKDVLGAEKSQLLELEGQQMGFEQAIAYAFDTERD